MKKDSKLEGQSKEDDKVQVQGGYLSFLKQNHIYRNLLYAYAISVLGQWFTTIALLGWVYSISQSGLMVSITLMSGALPRLILGPLAGVMVDRLPKKFLLISTDFCRALLVLLFVFAREEVWVVIGINTFISIIGVLYAPSRQSIIPSIVPVDQLHIANALTSTISGFMGIIGASFGGLVTAVLSYEVSFSINSFCYLISALLIFKASIPKESSLKTSGATTIMEDFKVGIQYAYQQPTVLAIMLVGVGWGFVGGAFQVLLPIYGTDIFQAGDYGIGILYSVQGLSIVCGGWIVSRYLGSNSMRMKKVFGWAYFAQGFFFIIFCVTTSIWVGAILLFCMRLGGGIIIPIDTTLLQTNTKQEMIGRIFALHSSIYGAITQLSMFITGLFLEWYPPAHVGIIFGVLCMFISFFWLVSFFKGKLVDQV